MNPVITQPIPGRQERPSLLHGDSARFLAALWQKGDVREARVLGRNGVRASGYFDDPDGLIEAVDQWDGTENIYVTLNPVQSSLLARSPGKLAARPRTTSADADVLERRWLFIDIDAEHPAGVSSSEEELSEAASVLDRLTTALGTDAWPEPITCLSGNGYYALYPVDLPNGPESKRLIEQVLKRLAARFDTHGAHIDTNVANASRLVGLVGSLKMKGTPTSERPHRRSRLLNLPHERMPVSRDLLDQVAGNRPNEEPSAQNQPEDLRNLLDAAGIDYREQPVDAQGIIWYQVRECPFHGAHRPYECGVGQAPDGHYAGKCFHDETKRWHEWKEALGLRPRGTPSRVGDATGTQSLFRHFPRSDAGNAELLAHLYGERVRYDHRQGKWYIWQGQHWDEDIDGEIARLALETVRTRYREAERLDDLGHRQGEARFAITSENRSRLEALLAQARSLHPIASSGATWDRDPLLLGVKNGVVDLSTGRLRPGRPEDEIRLFTPIEFESGATCPRWEQFLAEVFEEDTELVAFARLAVGYTLTGRTDEQCLFLLHGQGANGKSVFLSLLRELLGSHAYNAPFSTFELRGRTDITNDLAALAGRRLVTASETNEGTRLNEARIKALTGGDPVTARFLYGEHFTFKPQAKIFLAVNHLPVVEDLSLGFWRRVRLLPFNRTFTTDADPKLEEKLRTELPGILAWAVSGTVSWQASGLGAPSSVLAATKSYREASDPLADFLEECLTLDPPRSVGSAEAYGAYQSWAKAQGMTDREMLTLTAFGRKMGDRFASKKTKTGKRFLGVGLPGDPVQEVLA